MKILLYVLLIPAFAVLMSATTALVGAEPTCQLKTKFTGDFTNPTWHGGDECEGTCPTTGDCVRTPIDDNPLTRTYECQCPSGQGNTGCRGQTVWVRDTVEDPWEIHKLQCAGEIHCPDARPTCDYIDRGAVQGSATMRWASCACQ